MAFLRGGGEKRWRRVKEKTPLRRSRLSIQVFLDTHRGGDEGKRETHNEEMKIFPAPL